MKIQIYLSHSELHNRVIRTLSNAQLLDKVEVSFRPSFYQPKSAPQFSQTKTYHVERLAGNKLYCKELDRMLPVTPKGDLDKAALAHEISLRSL